MKAPHAYLELLQTMRAGIAEHMAGHEITAAACEVLDELIWRTRMITDHIPADAPLTRTLVEKAGDAYDVLLPVMKTGDQLRDLLAEGVEAINQRHGPFVRFLNRVKSEGFVVSEELDAVTDAASWPDPAPADAAAQVGLEAEKIARAEQGAAYQERVQRMAAGYRQVDTEYAERLRELIRPLPDIVTPTSALDQP